MCKVCSSHGKEAAVFKYTSLYASMPMLVQLYGVIMDDIHWPPGTTFAGSYPSGLIELSAVKGFYNTIGSIHKSLAQ